MKYIYRCKECESVQEEEHSMNKVTNKEDDIHHIIKCKNCFVVGKMRRIISAPLIATYDMATITEKKEMLKKRSREHTKKIGGVERFHNKNIEARGKGIG